ncbi:MAG: cytochrome c family protein [Methylobacteriaceae bacterium]|nr:cytochrome c family protein [Methylobacteriaceae bacterium]
MDSFEFNKIAGAVLGTLLFVTGLGILSEGIFYVPRPKVPGYDLPAEQAPAAGSAQAATTPAEPLPVLLAKADPKKGETDAKVCQTCHNFEKGGGIKTGPDLYGVLDRPKASFPGFSYSDALKSKGGNWSFEDLDAFINSPRGYANGTKMTFPGEKDPHKRADILAYLDKLSDNPAPLPKP